MDDTTRAKLNEKIPTNMIKTREAFKGGKILRYVSGAYVVNKLNEVLGQGHWGYQIESLNKVFEGEIDQYNGKAFTTSYIAQIRLEVGNYKTPEGYTAFTEVGYGDGTDRKSQGKAHELATKEAVTDGLKRAAKNLGNVMGLELYFAEGELDEPENRTSAGSTTNKASTPAELPDSEFLREQIKSTFSVLRAKKAITAAEFTAKYLEGGKTDNLKPDQAQSVLTRLNNDFSKELGLNGGSNAS